MPFTGEKIVTTCPKCNQETLECEIWESSDEAHEDEKQTCKTPGCGYQRWVEGSDY